MGLLSKMNLQEGAQKLKELHDQYCFKKSDAGYKFEVKTNERLFTELNAWEEFDSEIFSYKVGNKYVTLNTLKEQNELEVKVKINSGKLASKGIYIYFEWADFLSSKQNIFSPPANFLILSDMICYPLDKDKSKIKHFFEVSEFLNIFISNADHKIMLTPEIIEEVIFLHKIKIEIPIILDEACIEERLDGFSIITSLFSDNSHSEQKKSIFKEVLHGLLNNINKKERLSHLLINFGEFSKRLSENYQLFVSEFSFDDVRKEYEESKRDYLTKLNDIFSSVQTKMLGIPISLAIASIKISPITDSTSFWTNFLLLIAVILYSVMMFILISNQRHTLCAVKEEYQSHMGRLKHQYSEQYDSIKGIQTDLNIRHNFQEKCLRTFNLMLIGLLTFVIVLFTFNIPWNTVFVSIFENQTIKALLSFLCV